MTLDGLYTLLTGISGMATKVTYEAWPEGKVPAMPFICYLESRSENFAADNAVYHKKKAVRIELYSKRKDTATEALIEAALGGAGIYYDSEDLYLADECCHERIYEIEV